MSNERFGGDVGRASTHATPPGYDHDWFSYSPIVSRERLQWPHGARTAVAIVVHLGAAEWEPAQPVRPRAVAGRGIGPPPDVPRMSHREFGHRVGASRLASQLQEIGVRPAVVMDVLSAEEYPGLYDELCPSEVIAGGLSAVRPITSEMSHDEEADYIGHALDRLQVAVGSRPLGWLSPERSESARTPALLAEAGVKYVADWANDDIPYPAGGAAEGLWHFPLSWELSDEAAVFHRGVAPTVWARSVVAAFERLREEGGRMLALHLQPWLSGQAHRASSVDAILAHLKGADNVWFASPREIVQHTEEFRDGANSRDRHGGND